MRKKLFVIFFFLIIGFFFYQVKSLRPSVWDGSSRINFVFSAQTVAVASLETGNNLVIFKLPENLYLEVFHEFGQYQLGSVYELGKLEGKGGELLGETVQEYLGVPIGGYIRIANSKWQIVNSKKFILNWLILSTLGRGETNFSQWDLLRFWWSIKSLRSDKVIFIDLEETNILSEKRLPDESLIFETEFFRLDELVGKYFKNSRIEKEGIEVEILNATEHLGLANRVARLVMNMGGEIISIGNADNKIRNSKFEIRNEEIKKSYTVRKLEKVLGIKAEIGEMDKSRADLLILIGEDYWEKIK